jgi:hypothetical protein
LVPEDRSFKDAHPHQEEKGNGKPCLFTPVQTPQTPVLPGKPHHYPKTTVRPLSSAPLLPEHQHPRYLVDESLPISPFFSLPPYTYYQINAPCKTVKRKEQQRRHEGHPVTAGHFPQPSLPPITPKQTRNARELPDETEKDPLETEPDTEVSQRKSQKKRKDPKQFRQTPRSSQHPARRRRRRKRR